MLKKIYSLFISAILFSAAAWAQSSALKINVLDKKNNQPIPFVNVVLYSNGAQVAGAQTDFDGNAQIKPINAGKYTIKAALLGYQAVELAGIVVNVDKIEFVTVKMAAASVELQAVEKVEYKIPLIQKDNTSAGGTMTREDISAAPTRDVNSLASTAAGVYQQDAGKGLNIRGAREDATTYYVDGMKVTGRLGLPKSAIEQISTVTGGIPAQYGDATGGIINITSRGPSREFSGGVSAESSQFLDAFGHNLGEFSLSGPLYRERDKTKQPKAGFFISAQAQTDKDLNPGAVGAYVVKSDKLDALKAAPLSFNPNNGTIIKNADYLTKNDLEHLKYNPNARGSSYFVNGKIEITPFKGAVLAVGGNFNYYTQKNYDPDYSLMAYDNFADDIRRNWRGFARFTQKLEQGDESGKSASLVKNIFYSVQVDYNKDYRVTQNATYKDDLFRYGYIGKFKSYTSDRYTPDPNNPERLILTKHDAVDSIKFSNPDDTKTDQLAYTKQALNFFDQATNGAPITDLGFIAGFGGYYNGGGANSTVNSIFFNTGATPGLYRILDNQQFHAMASGSLDIKDHAISFGVEFEQKTNRFYGMTPVGLWNTMRLQANKHLAQLDKSDSTITQETDAQGHQVTKISYGKLYVADDQSTFDKRFRVSQNLTVTDKSFLDIDSYDPSAFKLSYFAADELIRDGGLNLRYYGYDYTGQVSKAKQNLNDFYDDKENRPVGAFQPNYIAAYIQDKFAFRDLIFNIGVRFDRYDANQKVLNDIYSFYAYRTAGDPIVAQKLSAQGLSKPANIGDDYAVYVNDANNPTQIVGYRNGDNWYSETGKQVDFNYVKRGPKMAPYLVDPTDAQTGNVKNNFSDYKPQYNFMPRIAFSFPISDVALFYAHYDVLTKRPNQDASQLDPFQYSKDYGASPYKFGYSNPGLKPERTTEYSLGFKQKLTNSSALTIEGFYREMRDMVALRLLKGGFPNLTYSTYTNADFGTVKGLTLGYDLRRTKNVKLTFNYTLSFADGTGSDQNTSSALTTETTPYIRAIFPLTYDQRHTFVANIDYRYGVKEEYNGPVIGGKRIFEDAGINFIARAGSGAPYTQSANAVSGLLIQVQNSGNVVTLGSINGANKPWNFKVDMKVDKNWDLKWKSKGSDEKGWAQLNTYLQIQNLFDNMNILNVFRFTGVPNDDGYLNTDLAKQRADVTVNPQAYYDIYAAKLNNNTNQDRNGNSYYALPRRIVIGLALTF